MIHVKLHGAADHEVLAHTYRVFHRNVSTRKSLLTQLIEIGGMSIPPLETSAMLYRTWKNQSNQHPTDVATQRRNMDTKKCVHKTEKSSGKRGMHLYLLEYKVQMYVPCVKSCPWI